MYKITLTLVVLLCITGLNGYVVTKDVPKDVVLEQLVPGIRPLPIEIPVEESEEESNTIVLPNPEANPCEVPEDVLQPWPPAETDEEEDFIDVMPELQPPSVESEEEEEVEAEPEPQPEPEPEPQPELRPEDVVPEVLPLPIEPEVDDLPIPETLPIITDPIDPNSDVEFLPDEGIVIMPETGPQPAPEDVLPEVLPLPIEPEIEELPIPETLPIETDPIDPNSDVEYLPLPEGELAPIETDEEGAVVIPHPEGLPVPETLPIVTDPIDPNSDVEYLPAPEEDFLPCGVPPSFLRPWPVEGEVAVPMPLPL